MTSFLETAPTLSGHSGDQVGFRTRAILLHVVFNKALVRFEIRIGLV